MKIAPPERLSGVAKIAVVAGSLALVAFVAAVVASCAPLKVGPFLPPHPVACSSDAVCPEHMHCAFPEVDSRSVCMEGDSTLDELPEMGAHRKALNCITTDDAGDLRYAHCADAGAP